MMSRSRGNGTKSQLIKSKQIHCREMKINGGGAAGSSCDAVSVNRQSSWHLSNYLLYN